MSSSAPEAAQPRAGGAVNRGPAGVLPQLTSAESVLLVAEEPKDDTEPEPAPWSGSSHTRTRDYQIPNRSATAGRCTAIMSPCRHKRRLDVAKRPRRSCLRRPPDRIRPRKLNLDLAVSYEQSAASALPGSLVANPRLESCTEGKPARRGK